MTTCSECDGKIFARGFCQKHYTRMRKFGRIERINGQTTGVCSVEGCGRPDISKGFCHKHYRYADHPLKNPWKLLRCRYPLQYPASWDRFENFLKDVPDRPHPKSQLRRIDATVPWSKTNFRWTVPVPKKDSMEPQERTAYAKAWNLHRKFKMTIDDRAKMLAAQGGACAICQAPERDGPKGDSNILHVDHDHKTGKPRALLCSSCNRALGFFNDDPALLNKAADYLDLHNGVSS